MKAERRKTTVVKNRRKTDISKVLEAHFEEDRKNFETIAIENTKQNEVLAEIVIHMKKNNTRGLYEKRVRFFEV